MIEIMIENKYYYNADFVKGILIFFVILGHVLQGTLQESILRNVIYSFHMPLFIGVSGFLLNKHKLCKLNIKELFIKYLKRLLIPWLLAVIVYEFVLNINNVSFYVILKESLKALIYPYYHLWFVLGYLSYIILYYFLVKSKVSDNNITWISIITSITFYALKHMGLININNANILTLVLHDFRLEFFVFFILGIKLKRYKLIDINNTTKIIIIILFLVSILILFYIPNDILGLMSFYCFNSLVLLILINDIKQNKFTRVKFIEWVGKNSFAFYLYHVLAIIFTRLTFGTSNLIIFYTINLGLFIVYTFFIFMLSKVKLFNEYIFGSY